MGFSGGIGNLQQVTDQGADTTNKVKISKDGYDIFELETPSVPKSTIFGHGPVGEFAVRNDVALFFMVGGSGAPFWKLALSPTSVAVARDFIPNVNNSLEFGEDTTPLWWQKGWTYELNLETLTVHDPTRARTGDITRTFTQFIFDSGVNGEVALNRAGVSVLQSTAADQVNIFATTPNSKMILGNGVGAFFMDVAGGGDLELNTRAGAGLGGQIRIGSGGLQADVAGVASIGDVNRFQDIIGEWLEVDDGEVANDLEVTGNFTQGGTTRILAVEETTGSQAIANNVDTTVATFTVPTGTFPLPVVSLEEDAACEIFNGPVAAVPAGNAHFTLQKTVNADEYELHIRHNIGGNRTFAWTVLDFTP